MKLKWMIVLAPLSIVTVLLSISTLRAADAVEWSILKTLKLEAAPIDVAVSADGRRIFVLTDQGKILIYDPNAVQEDEIDVGADVDKIQVGPEGDILFLNSRTNKTVKVISLDFIQNINVSGSPFKGPADAPIVIAVFDDFQ
jgi:hypothetical protein